MSDSARHTRVTAELAAYSRPTTRILKASLIELLGETIPEEGIIDVEGIEAPISSSNMHIRRGPKMATTDHDRPTLRMKPFVKPTDE